PLVNLGLALVVKTGMAVIVAPPVGGRSAKFRSSHMQNVITIALDNNAQAIAEADWGCELASAFEVKESYCVSLLQKGESDLTFHYTMATDLKAARAEALDAYPGAELIAGTVY
ncbi:MAG: hypothetical protein RR672_11615, partial [Raoultibacter sp.]